MGVLSNQRHELFARALAEGKGSLEAYISVGYKSNAANASNLAHKSHIQARVQEINNFAVLRTEISVEGLIRKSEQIQEAAIADKQFSAAITALTATAKLAGLWIERGENTNQNTTYVVSDQPMTDEEWTAERVTEH